MHRPAPCGQVYLEIDGAHARSESVVLLHGMASCGEDWLLQRAALRGRDHAV
ncbi:MAG: hypothetical protein MUO23_12305 [Anaerolineales bacterium]|nr:hypothetical protein [Anaerolineales bacterium]